MLNVSNVLETMWKENVFAYFKIIFRYLAGKTEEWH